MATKSKVVDPSFRIGAGRYIQDDGVIADLSKEIRNLGGSKPFVLAGDNAYALLKDKVDAILGEDGMKGEYYLFKGFCVKEHCKEIVESDAFKNCDIVVGMGGGILMDASKLCAVWGNKPVILIPTSSATCAAYAPLSVTYNEIGQHIGSVHHNREVNCVLADMEILSKQPVRLFKSGVYDSLAKILEINQRMLGRSEEELEIGFRTSYELSKFLYERLSENFDEACHDIENGINSKKVYDCVYLAICVTGVVSGLARGSNQTAIGHKVYDAARSLFPYEVTKFLHGEVVAVGLIAQLYYNGKKEQAQEFARVMKSRGMKISLNEMGVAHTEENLEALYNNMLASSAMAGADEEEHAVLKEALKLII